MKNALKQAKSNCLFYFSGISQNILEEINFEGANYGILETFAKYSKIIKQIKNEKNGNNEADKWY